MVEHPDEPARSNEPAGSFASWPFYVLAGGRSLRMGRDKAGIELDGASLLARAIGLGRPFGSTTVVAKERPGSLPEPAGFLADRSGDFAPVHGLAAALDDAAIRGAAWAVVVAVDLPLLTATSLERLARIAASEPGEIRAAVPVVDGRLQVLAAAWRPAVRLEFAGRLAGGDPSLHRLVEAGRWRPVMAAELGAGAEEFLNVNRPEDLARARRLLGSGETGQGDPR